MTTRQIIFISTFIILSLLTEKAIWYLFPYTGLGGLICWPSTIIISGISSYIIYRAIRKRGLNQNVIFMTAILFVIDTLLLIEIHPQESGGDQTNQIGQFISAVRNYDQIDFDSFASLNKAERVIYIYKFQNRLPSSISTLNIEKDNKDNNENTSRNYELYNYYDSIKYDTAKIMLQQNGDFVILTEKSKPNFGRRHVIRRTFLDDNGTGYIDTTTKYFYNINRDNFELKSGIEKEFYRLLKLIKTTSR